MGGNIFTRDYVMYSKQILKGEKLNNRIVAIKDPFSTRVLFRRVIAEEHQWVQRIDDGGIIKIPNGHVWIEGDNEDEERTLDSLNAKNGGPISKKHIYGPCEYIVWPIWRATSFRDLHRFSRFSRSKQPNHSKVYSSDEIFVKYGL